MSGKPNGSAWERNALCWTADKEKIIAMSVRAICTTTACFWKDSCFEMVDDAVTGPCPDILFVVHQNLSAHLVPYKLCLFHNDMQRFSTVWHSYGFKGLLKK